MFYLPLRNEAMQCISFLVFGSLTDSFQNSLKTRIKFHKIAYTMFKNCLRGLADKGEEGGEHVRMGE